eukprot:CAMPEP_0168434102 /NCGR_PEP_ID=MMETSP0228-20121227/39737_1 /TAXON_ID=133427 /ORGANISM="Protoceratium reticulatum, Strain CCCM 535 (=CCMP 1889)" /LENGTH=116 /DNA_ID=CAMNT_0008448257 /DNA_START=30 /DNA_END=381 /DNA_ORIENTATION=-
MPFAAAAPVTPYVMSIERAKLLSDFPMWIFYGSNDLVARTDDAVNAAVNSGTNRDKETLLFTKYRWSSDTGDSFLHPNHNKGHGTYEQAYGEAGLFSWLLQQRRSHRLQDVAVPAG